MIGHYDWAGGREAWLRFGPTDGPIVIAALPLFEEANRVRALMVTMLRALGARGIGGVLPDLPGQGESLVPTAAARLADWRAAFAAAAGASGAAHSVAIRGGALIDGQMAAASRWHFAPATGAMLVRDLKRAHAVTGGDALDVDGDTVTLAGNIIDRTLLAHLDAAVPESAAPLRTVRLASDAQPADRTIEASPLWRRAEPDNDPTLAALLADDIAEWVRRCAG